MRISCRQAEAMGPQQQVLLAGSLSAEAAFLQLDRDGDKEVNLNEFIQWLKTAP